MTVSSATGSQWVQPTSVSSVPSGNGYQQSSSQQTTAAPAQQSPPYFSPATHVDPSTGIAVLVVLDDQGKITEQYPSQQVVDEYRRHQAPGQNPVKATNPVVDAPPTTQVQASGSGSGSTSSGQNQGGSSTAA